MSDTTMYGKNRKFQDDIMLASRHSDFKSELQSIYGDLVKYPGFTDQMGQSRLKETAARMEKQAAELRKMAKRKL